MFGEVAHNLDAVTAQLEQVQRPICWCCRNCCDRLSVHVTGRSVSACGSGAGWADNATTPGDRRRAARPTIVAGLAERAGTKYLIPPSWWGQRVHRLLSPKTHLFFRGNAVFNPGDSGFQVWDIGAAKIGVMICFDWYYPESARTLALLGAEIIAHPPTWFCRTVRIPW